MQNSLQAHTRNQRQAVYLYVCIRMSSLQGKVARVEARARRVKDQKLFESDARDRLYTLN